MRALIGAGHRETADDIRRFRQEIPGLEDDAPAKSLSRSSISSRRAAAGFVFHVVEHQTTIPAIKQFLAANDLAFIGFDGPMRPEYAERFPPTGQTDLIADQFELEHPTALTRTTGKEARADHSMIRSMINMHATPPEGKIGHAVVPDNVGKPRRKMGGKGDHYGAHDCAPNPLFCELIDRFRPATGVPMLLNTSLNGKDEPLIETPDDALRFWKSSPIDIMVIGDAMFRR